MLGSDSSHDCEAEQYRDFPANSRRKLIRSVQAKRDLDIDLHRNRYAVFASRFESPLADRLDCFLIQSHTQRALNVNVMRPPIRTHHNPQNHGSLVLRFAGFVGKLRVRRIDRPGRGDTTAYPVGSSADSAAVPGSDTGTSSGTNATSAAGTNPTSETSAVGWWPKNRRERIAQRTGVRKHDLWWNHDRCLHR